MGDSSKIDVPIPSETGKKKINNKLAVDKEKKTVLVTILTNSGFEKLCNEMREKFSQIIKVLSTDGNEVNFRLIIESEIQLSPIQEDSLMKTLKFISTYHSLQITEDLSEESKIPSKTSFTVSKASFTEGFKEIRIATVGNVDAGKSTLLGVLTHNSLDDGRGSMRVKVMRFPHEKENGRTSSVANVIMGFDSEGKVTNKPHSHTGTVNWSEVCRDSSKIIGFIDLAGHAKYLKTTIFGLLSHYPDYIMVIVGANSGIVGMAKEHLGLSIAIQKPLFFVITKIDMTKHEGLLETRKTINSICKSAVVKRTPINIKSEPDLIYALYDFTSLRACPIFEVSSVDGSGLDNLKTFLSKLTPFKVFDTSQPAILPIDDVFRVSSAGCVVTGILIQGSISCESSMLLGPDKTGKFTSVNPKSIHRRRSVVDKAFAGEAISVSLKKINRTMVRKGMVLVSESLMPVAYWEFDAAVQILHHPTTIESGYQPCVHIECVRQSATIVSIENGTLRSGDSSNIRMQFLQHPEFIRVGSTLLFREGRTKAVGTIIKVYEKKESHIISKKQNKLRNRIQHIPHPH